MCRFTRYLIENQAFSQPLIVVDVGVRGGFDKRFDVYQGQVKLLGFDADREECERLNAIPSDQDKRYYPLALYKDKGYRTFYATSNPASSGFYPPDTKFCQRFLEAWEGQKVVSSQQIETTDLDSFLREEGIGGVDFVKIDAEGCELDILKGASAILQASVLGVQAEVSFSPIHTGQPLFRDIDSYLQSLGFRLFRLSTRPLYRLPFYLPQKGGQAIFGYALYFRDGVEEINRGVGGWSKVRIQKLASLMELFNLQDCALELLIDARLMGKLLGLDEDLVEELLLYEQGKEAAILFILRHLKRLIPIQLRRLLLPVQDF